MYTLNMFVLPILRKQYIANLRNRMWKTDFTNYVLIDTYSGNTGRISVLLFVSVFIIFNARSGRKGKRPTSRIGPQKGRHDDDDDYL